MIVVIPYGTDTPIYHWPFATAAIIATNIVTYILQVTVLPTGGEGGTPDWEGYSLSYGDGLHPHQWLTSLIMHADPMHLIGNMLFLWAFGIIVEGKVGPFWFTVLYFAIGITQCMLEQILALGSSGPGSLGASAAIYGLLVLAMFWAPADNNLCLVLVLLYVIPHVPVPIAIFAAFYLLFDFGLALFSGFELSTPFLHILGAAVGVVPAVFMLRHNLVRCDNEDLLSRLREVLGLKQPIPPVSKKEQARLVSEQAELADENARKRELTEKSIARHMSVGNIPAAVHVFNDFRKHGGNLQWSETQLRTLIRHFNQAKNHEQTLVCIDEYVQRFQEQAAYCRLLAAKIWLVDRGYPRRAMKLLMAIPPETLDPNLRTKREQLVKAAQADIDAGILEPEL